MAHVVEALDAPSSYRDSRSTQSRWEQQQALETTATLYIGNLSFFTTEEQMYELFSRVADPAKGGGIRRIIMGLDRNQKTPCGFAFVEFYTHAEAVDCMRLVSGTKLDERIIRCDLDPGYKEGRQYGRGRSGGQVRDEYRQEFDAGRGGWGHNRLREEEERKRAEEMEAKRRREHEEVYLSQEREQGGRIVPTGAEGMYEEREAWERTGLAPAAVGGAVGQPDGHTQPQPAKRQREDSEEADASNKVGLQEQADMKPGADILSLSESTIPRRARRGRMMRSRERSDYVLVHMHFSSYTVITT